MHTILGAGGAISNNLVRELLGRGEKLRLVSRRARPHPGTEVVAADLNDQAQTLAAVDGSAVVYLVAGLPYQRSSTRPSVLLPRTTQPGLHKSPLRKLAQPISPVFSV